MVTESKKEQAKDVDVEQEVTTEHKYLLDNIVRMASLANERELAIIHRFLKNLLKK